MHWTFDRFGFTDPWRIIDSFSRMESGKLPTEAEFPLINVWMDGDKAIAASELPGVDPKDVEIAVDGKVITLRGARATDTACPSECRHRHERWTGKFDRSIELPFTIDQEKVEARFNKGVLQLTLPRAEADKPRRIPIQTE